MPEIIYTATFGEVKQHKIVNITPKGYRVKSGDWWNFTTVVFNIKQYAGWVTCDEKIYYQQRAFAKKSHAECFANKQLLCMENFYSIKLRGIKDLILKLEK